MDGNLWPTRALVNRSIQANADVSKPRRWWLRASAMALLLVITAVCPHRGAWAGNAIFHQEVESLRALAAADLKASQDLASLLAKARTRRISESDCPCQCMGRSGAVGVEGAADGQHP